MTSERNLNTSQLLKPAEIVKMDDLDKAVEAAKNFCQEMRIEHSHWKGVPPSEDRIEQARESLKKLRGFYSNIIALDTSNWQEFKNLMSDTSFGQLSNEEKVTRIAELLEIAYVPHVTWISIANVELPFFLDYLNALKKEKYPTWTAVVQAHFDSHRISVITSEFLTAHVGEGNRKVVRVVGDEQSVITGFDGEEMSCPISVAPGRGVVYFAYVCAEYVLMNAIAEKFLSNNPQQND